MRNQEVSCKLMYISHWNSVRPYICVNCITSVSTGNCIFSFALGPLSLFLLCNKVLQVTRPSLLLSFSKFYRNDTFGLKTLGARGDVSVCLHSGVKHVQWHSNITVFKSCIEKWLTWKPLTHRVWQMLMHGVNQLRQIIWSKLVTHTDTVMFVRTVETAHTCADDLYFRDRRREQWRNCTNIHDPVENKGFRDPLTFPLAPPWGSHVRVLSEMLQAWWTTSWPYTSKDQSVAALWWKFMVL